MTEDTRLQRSAALARALLKDPRTSLRGLEQAHGLAPAESEAKRFSKAMDLLTGLDLRLTFSRGGYDWTVRPGRDRIADQLFRDGVYEGRTLEAVLAWARRNRSDQTVIVDVGANIGTTTLPFAHAGYQVLAIEPVAEALELLRRNIDTNGYADLVEIVEAAVTEDGKAVFVAVSTSLGNSEVVAGESEVASFERSKRSYGRAATIELPGVRLDDALANSRFGLTDVALVWCDIQGSEPAAVKSGEGLWQAGIPLFTELQPHSLETHGGLAPFLAAIEQRFPTYLSVEQLLAGDDSPRPSNQIASLATELAERRGHTDILLLPQAG